MRIRSCISVISILFATIIINTTWQYQLEHYARYQVRTNTLKSVKKCMLNSKNTDVIDILQECASGVHTTPTGDMFAYNLNTKRFVFDPSLDCHVEGGKSMTIESECTLHKDKSACKEALVIMNKGFDSFKGLDTKWNFDGSDEWLEWFIYPDESYGLNGKIKTGFSKPEQILVAIGIQKDELFSEFKLVDLIIKFLGGFAIIVVLLAEVYYRQFGCRTAP